MALLLGWSSQSTSLASPGNDSKGSEWGASSRPDGSRVTALSRDQTRAVTPNRVRGAGVGVSRAGGGGSAAIYEFEYKGVSSCRATVGATCAPESAQESACGQLEEGPLTMILRRPAGGGAWTQVGMTCSPGEIPGGVARPQLTVEMVRRAFVDTPFARPGLRVQPVGNRTLVTLPAFFEVRWPVAGFQPLEVRAVRLLGHAVRIKPVLGSNRFRFGDGGGLGPTKSLGGAYPDGDVVHAYSRPGRFGVSVATTYSGEFSVDGGPWQPVPGSVTVAGPGQSLQVLTAKNRLVAD